LVGGQFSLYLQHLNRQRGRLYSIKGDKRKRKSISWGKPIYSLTTQHTRESMSYEKLGGIGEENNVSGKSPITGVIPVWKEWVHRFIGKRGRARGTEKEDAGA